MAAATERAERAERQLNELNHRVANALQIASSLVRAQRGRVADPLAGEALDATTARLAPAIEGTTGLACTLDVEAFEVPSETALHLAHRGQRARRQRAQARLR